jgi:lipopolysaccharide transport system permease protein
MEGGPESGMVTGGEIRSLELSNSPDTWRAWWADLARHRDVLFVLARKDFQTRYKRASLGIAWAVIVPLIQATVMAIVFSHVVRVGGGRGYGAYVMSGIIPFSYFSLVLMAGSTSIVDGSSFADKVWFPRVLLVVVPCLSSLPGFLVTTIALVGLIPVLGATYGLKTLLLIPGILLLVAFCCALSLVVSALHVYFRDVRFLVQAALMIWMYVTPIVYQVGVLHHLQSFVEANPLTGIVTIFHMATVGSHGPWHVPLAVSLGTTIVLLVVGLHAQRKHDRLFVDLL